MRVEHLYRYPVKGLTPEALEEAEVTETGLPWDRAFALALADTPFDPEHPAWFPKSRFMCLMKNARAAKLRASFNPHNGRLTIRGPDGGGLAENALTEDGRARIGAYLSGFLNGEAPGARFFQAPPGHVFQDQRRPVVSLINLASLADYEARLGAERDRMRFRANVYFRGAPAWVEHEWIGRLIQVGGARLRVIKPIDRCPATEVNPLTGERDADPVRELRRLFGHIDLGVHAAVEEGGVIAVGDALEALPQ